MSKNSKKFEFRKDKKVSVINYDLSKYGNISAATISKASDGSLYNSMSVDKVSYNLPNTTLWGWLNREEAEQEFLKAFNKVRDTEVLTRLLIIEIDGKNALISNDE
ncbi:MAG: hypothetical protein IJD57_01555 [Candidatus Gastranaerophilales bacterium]|nr:hypothetical protein [Candidatus Gastranaerophilales bacterium]